MAKIMQAQITYKCGHVWTSQYSRGASAQEVKAAQARSAKEICPKCKRAEDILRNEA